MPYHYFICLSKLDLVILFQKTISLALVRQGSLGGTGSLQMPYPMASEHLKHRMNISTLEI